MPKLIKNQKSHEKKIIQGNSSKIRFNDHINYSIINTKQTRKYKIVAIIHFLIIINLLTEILSNNILLMIESNFSKISLIIKGTGEQNVFGSNSQYYKVSDNPKEVHINNVTQEFVNYSYYFEQEENYVELIWDKNIKACNLMFECCSNITFMDFSEFDSSEVTGMYRMFDYCTSLISINFTNFNTSKVKNMYRTFYQCSSLVSLDLSSFDTSNVIHMHQMFDGCSSLTSLNLSNFDTSKLSEMKELFKDCK